MNHTPESLLALTKSPEGLEELRIIAAHADKMRCVMDSRKYEKGITAFPAGYGSDLNDPQYRIEVPNYPTSLDAIFAAEERLGLHDEANRKLRAFWYVNASKYFDPVWADPAQRTVIFILTAQWKEQNP